MAYRMPDEWRQYFISKERAVHRVDPVPGTGKNNWSFGNFYRTANCWQERKLYGDPDHRRYGRGKRYPDNLPNAYDDYPKSRVHNKYDWKKIKKKKQWMKRGIKMISFSPGDNKVQMDAADSPKKPNYDMSETKAKGEDYTRPGMDASQTEDDNLRIDPVEEDYEVPENRKNPERDAGRPGIRKRIDPDTGLPLEGIEFTEIEVPEDDTPVAVDDSRKHGTKLKYRIGGDEGKTGPE